MSHRIVALLLALSLVLSSAGSTHAKPAAALAAAPEPAFSSVMFIENVGQFAEGARFQVWGGSAGTMWLADDAIWLTVVEPRSEEAALSSADPKMRFDPRLANTEQESTPRKAANVKLSFVGANPHPRIEPFDRLDTAISYFIGNEPDKWRPDVPVWGGVRYVDLYPGVDLEITNEGGQVVQRLAARPGADLEAVQLQVEGADAVTVDGHTLRLSTAAGVFATPLLLTGGMGGNIVVQSRGDQVFNVDTPFAPTGVRPQSAITIPQSPTDNSAHLIYGTYLGGTGADYSEGIAVDAQGSAYVVGWTYSSDFPTTLGAVDPSFNGGQIDAFVVKLNPTGTGLVYATFLGSSYFDYGLDIAVDTSGNAYVTGVTYAGDFPTTSGAFDPNFNGGYTDAFVVKLNLTGSALVYATFLGGSGVYGDSGNSIVVDTAASAYVTGRTYSGTSGDFPTTSGAFDTTFNGDYKDDAFVVKLNSTGSRLTYSTYLGGEDDDNGESIAVDTAGNAYVTGSTKSPNFPTTAGAFDTDYNDSYNTDAFVVKFNSTGSMLTYSTYLGGEDDDNGESIAVDAAGNAYMTGFTKSPNFPTTLGAFDTQYNTASREAVVVKLNSSGKRLSYATFLGGSVDNFGADIVVDAMGSAYVTGFTYSLDFPTTPDAFDTSYNGPGRDAFMVKLYPEGSGLNYATFLSGSGDDSGYGIVLNANGQAYATGQATSTNFPTTLGAFDVSYNGGDGFVVKLSMGPPPPIDAADLAAQSDYLTVAPGAAISPWVEVRNTGTTTWTPAEYGWNGKGALDGTMGYMPRNVAPGETQRFFWNLTAPTTPGTYDYGFMLRHGTQEFGPYFFVRVTVVSPKWTLMYYLAGDNDLESGMDAALVNLQTRVAQARNPWVRVVTLTDGRTRGDSAYHVIESSGTTRIAKDELNTGAPQTLADFITWAKTNQPAERYALIVAGHGTGISGVALDQSTGIPFAGEDYLILRELRDAVSSKVNVVYMRACLMGMIEPAYELRDRTDFYVASQTYMVTAGVTPVPVELGIEIPAISNSTTPADLAKAYFDAYRQQYLSWNPGAISVLDMSKFTLLVSKVNALAQALTTNMVTEKGILLSMEDAGVLQRFDMNGDHRQNAADEYVDLYDFAVQLRLATSNNSVAAAAGDVESAVQQIVGDTVYSASGSWNPGEPRNDHSQAHGISIFWPSQRRSFLQKLWSSWADGVDSWLPQSAFSLGPNHQAAGATNVWMQLLIDFTNLTNPVDNPNPPLPVAVTVDYPYHLHLPIVTR